MKKLILATSFLAAGAMLANAAVEDWNWKDYYTADTENKAAYFSNLKLESFDSTGDFAIRVDFSGLDYTENSTAESYFVGIKFNEGSNGTYCGIRLNNSREAYLFTYGNVKNASSKATVDATSISGDLTVSIEYDSEDKLASVFFGETLLGTTGFNFDWTTDKLFAIGAGSPPEDHSANNLSHSFSYDSGMKISVAIPEPSAFGMLAGLGALALVGARRRRR